MIKIRVLHAHSAAELMEVELRPEEMLNQECLVGRSSSCGLVLPSAEASRLHGKITWQQGAYHYMDLASTGGSWVNGQPVVVNQATPLKAGDHVRLGDCTLLIRAITSPTPPAQQDGRAPRASRPPLPRGEPPRLAGGEGLASVGPQLWSHGDLRVRCVRVIEEAPAVKTFCLSADPPVLFRFRAGQRAVVEVDLDGEVLARAYPVASPPSRPYTLELAIKRPAPGGDGRVSAWLHQRLRAGGSLRVRGFEGRLRCAEGAGERLLLLSAGMGAVPLMSMLRWICDTAADLDVVYVHCARTPAELLFREELELLARRHQNVRVVLVTTQRAPGQPWTGVVGRLDEARLTRACPDAAGRLVYLCGPEPFRRDLRAAVLRAGVPPQRCFEDDTEAPPQAATPGGPALEVSFSRSGKRAACDADDTILEVAEREGVAIPQGCRNGSCGSCKLRKLSGEVQVGETDGAALSEEERREGFILACAARPRGRVVMDA